MSNNIAILTQAHAAVAAKKRARRDQIKEIVFDEHARRSLIPNPFHAPLSSFPGIFSLVFINESSKRPMLQDKKLCRERSRRDKRCAVRFVYPHLLEWYPTLRSIDARFVNEQRKMLLK
jgi:hypothetical protein